MDNQTQHFNSNICQNLIRIPLTYEYHAVWQQSIQYSSSILCLPFLAYIIASLAELGGVGKPRGRHRGAQTYSEAGFGCVYSSS